MVGRNDAADKAATLNANLMTGRTQYKNTKSLYQTAFKRKWNQEWIFVSNNHLRNHKVVLSRLRIGHTKLTHKFLMGRESPPICKNGLVRITVKRFLTKRPKFEIQEIFILDISQNKYFGKKILI